MSNRRTEIQAHSRDGDRFQVTSQDTDSPILPVAQLKALHEFRPDLIDWVVKRTEEEASNRRSRQTRVDQYVFIERIGGLVGGFAIALVGLLISAYLAMHGQPEVAAVVGGGTLVSIVSIIVTGRKKSVPASEQTGSEKKK